VDGRGGSGKSTLAKQLASSSMTIIVGDDWFEPLTGEARWGDFNEHRFATDVLDPIRAGVPPAARAYDWSLGRIVDGGRFLIDHVAIVERCYLLGSGVEWDVSIWIETPRSVCLERALARELVERPRLVHVWTTIWQPQEDAYIARVKPTLIADIVLDGTTPFTDQRHLS